MPGLSGLLSTVPAGITALVPEQYAAFRPLLEDGLRFFLEHISPVRLSSALEHQESLPANMGLPDRVTAFLLHFPSLHKLGQVVARDRRLDPHLRRRLQRLESLAPTTTVAEVLPIIRSEMGDGPRISVAPRVLAEGSVGIVVPFTMREGSSISQQGVFKILRPGVEERLQEELTIWSALGPFLEERSAHYGLPELSYRETLEGVAKQLLNEIRLDCEQEHLAKASELYGDFPPVLIPRLFPFSTARMTAMERVYGRKVTQGRFSEMEGRRLAELVTEALIARPFWSGASVVTFHADPHAGNLFRTRDGRLAILDWSLVVRLAKAEIVKIINILLAALTLDERGLCQAVSDLAQTVPDESALLAAVREGLRQVRAGTFPALDWMLALLDGLATSCHVVFSEEMTLFRKALLALMGALADLSNVTVADGVLVRTGMTKLGEEFFSRLLASPRSRAFSTHLSNEDLFLLWASWPVTAARFWLGTWEDRLAEVRNALRRRT